MANRNNQRDQDSRDMDMNSDRASSSGSYEDRSDASFDPRGDRSSSGQYAGQGDFGRRGSQGGEHRRREHRALGTLVDSPCPEAVALRPVRARAHVPRDRTAES